MDDTTPLLAGQDSTQSLTSFKGSTELDHAEEGHGTKRPTLTCNLAFAVAVCILGSSFQVGYNTGVVNSPAEVIKDFYNATNIKRNGEPISGSLLTALWAITVSSYAAGGMIGGLSAGFWANRYGRRGALLRNNLLIVVAAGLLGFSKFAKSYEMLIAGRIISGINAGINSGVAPLYLSEISPVALRGLCGTFNQLAITFGVLIAEVIGLGIALGTESLWPFILALVWLRSTEDVGEELEEMRKEAVEQRNSVKFAVSDLFRNPELKRPLIICLVLQLAQQFSGINAVIYYSTRVFEDAGLSKSVAQYATAGTGVVNVGMTFVSAILMDRLGRRTLMIWGLGGMFVFTVMLTMSLVFQSSVSWLSYLCITAVVLYITSFATGPGSIPWFYVAELFAQGPRSAAVSVSVLVNWLANFTVGLVFPELQDSIDEYSFVPFAAVLFACFLFVIFFVPETKGKRIEEITLLFKAPDEISETASRSDMAYRQISENSDAVNIQVT